MDRRLAAILALDVVGYSRLIRADEEGTIARLTMLRDLVIDPIISQNSGRIFKTTGDGLFVEFVSAVDAIRCAIAIQSKQNNQKTEVPPEEFLEVRIGVNLGDIVVQNDDMLGDGVNVAARLEAISEPGGFVFPVQSTIRLNKTLTRIFS
ncbi:MAG: adenylate/guanylate cyclase domain-containing protein [Hyphomicrobiales bacterium]|nr:adenylate/guanylate cyclase domain-containing protein [Hyphomicrobiales bacterium]